MNKSSLHTIAESLALVLAFISSATTARANVYATDIQINGSLYGITNNPTPANPAIITYRIDESDTTNVTVAILNGSTTVATIAGGTNMGLNTVKWGGTNNARAAAQLGTYSVNITASARGFPFWTQISVDTNAGNYAFFPNGMAVDCNTNSPYYGRVVVGNAYEGGANPVTQAYNYDGIYKMNADGSFADEGGFGFGGYTNDDRGDYADLAGEMPSASLLVPWTLRIGDDDRIYMLDYSSEGAVIAFDMRVTTNQTVIDDGGVFGGQIGGPNNYSTCDDLVNLFLGIDSFDVTSTTTRNAAIWLCDSDYPNWGIWMFHMTNGASDANDTEGIQAVYAGGPELSLVSSGGCTIDTNLDIFVSQTRYAADNTDFNSMDFTNWNHGILPPEHGGTNYADGQVAGEVLWGDEPGSTNDYSWEGIEDTVINNHTHPTMVALPLGFGYDTPNNGGGIKVLNVADGSVVSVTNGATVQSLTNIDWGNIYTCAAWDNVGNLYAASTTTNVWRAWSPPGANTNTTFAVAKVVIAPASTITIFSITTTPTTPGCAVVTITFTAPDLAPSAFKLIGSPTVNGVYTTDGGATISGSLGAYQATVSNCSTMFYRIEEPSD